MEKILQQEQDTSIWQDAAWYRALTFRERLTLLRTDADTIFFPQGEVTETAMRRFQAWKEQSSFGKGTTFGERLASDALSEEDMLSLLAEPAEVVQARSAASPDWLVVLMDAFADPHAFEQVLPLDPEHTVDHPLVPCLQTINPLLRRGFTALQDAIEGLQHQYAFLPFDPQKIPHIFLHNIAAELLFEMGKPIILEMHIARLQGRLHGETSEDRFADFMRQLSEEKLIVPLLAKYPVLARQLVMTIDHWTCYLREVLEHLCADWPTICATIFPGSDPGLVVEMEAGMGDRHRKGRNVLALQFSSGMQLLYKPKSLAVDVHFQELLTWLNEQGAQPPLRVLKLIDRGEYGWSEFVVASSCTSQDEVTRFYERQGSYLALLYALEAVDLHNENVIAVGEHPILVDLEALFHPRVEGNDLAPDSNLAAVAMDQSVWQVGLLPRRLWTNDDSPGLDMSGLGGLPGQKLPHPLYAWQETGSDQMRLARKYVEMDVSQNRPQLNGHDVEVLDYKDAIVAGFTGMYRLLVKQRETLLTEQLPRFAHDEIRVVVRSTQIYGVLLFESFHPSLLRDALDRDRFFDYLWGEVKRHPFFARLLPAELQDLFHGDIPVFTTFPDSRTIFTSERTPLVDFFDMPPLERVRQRIQHLDEDDLFRQIWVIEASLTTLLMDREDASKRHLLIKPAQVPVPREHILSMALAVGKRLEEIALQNDAGAYWLGVNYIRERTWSLLPTDIDLYNGTSGIALFLGYLGVITGEASYTFMAQRALASVRAQIKEQQKFAAKPGMGAFNGLGSCIYLLTHLSRLWNEPALLQEAEELVEQLPELIAKDNQLDIINGSAGCILSLLGLYAFHPSPRVLEVAVQCGDRLLATALAAPGGTAWETLPDQAPLGGFSHGTAGIAFSLLRLAASSGQERFYQTAVTALAYDRSLFVPELHNWADLRVFSEQRSREKQSDEPSTASRKKSMVAWCHGAPGIGLGRLGALDLLDDGKIREEIDIALNTTLQQGFAGNHSLCHGALGDIELPLTAAQVLNRPADWEALERAIALVIGSIEANGWVTAVPFGVETPGLMIGLAGIGYELLRLAEPDRVPSALLLAPPCVYTKDE